MLRRILRAIDLSFTFSERARMAGLAARAQGMPLTVMYDGGLDVKANDLLPHFRRGKPTAGPRGFRDISAIFVVGQLGDNGVLMMQKKRYDPTADQWLPLESHWQRDVRNGERRQESDYWLTSSDFFDAFVLAARSAGSRQRAKY